MMSLKGAEIPPEIVVPHVMREVTRGRLQPRPGDPDVSGTSLVPDNVLALMFPNG